MEGGRGYLRRGKKIGYERFESVRGECVRVKLLEHHHGYFKVNMLWPWQGCRNLFVMKG